MLFQHAPHARGLVVLCAALLVSVALFIAYATPSAGEHEACTSDGDMDEAAMQQWVDAWFASNPVVGRAEAPLAAPAAVTFQAVGSRFNADGSSATVVDTVVIGIGETVQWQRLIGTHTVTSGTGAGDLNAGLVFDVPLDAANPVFAYTFNRDGVFPFFCRPHETFEMKGVVVVIGATPAHESTWGDLKARHR